MLLGCIGALIVLFGITQTPPQAYYITGAVALFATAAYFRLLYFVALEFILIAGHTALILGSGPYTQFFLPVLLCFQLLVFYSMFGKENSIFLVLGVIGIALLSIGFAYNDQWIFFIGSSFIATYSYYSGYRGLYPSYIWASLNTVFALFSLYKIIGSYF
ncbi:MAG: hypothetical protein ACRCXC_06440 [Legionella sp.]